MSDGLARSFDSEARGHTWLTAGTTFADLSRISRFLTEKLETLRDVGVRERVRTWRERDEPYPICLTLPARVSSSFSIRAQVSENVGDSPGPFILPVAKSMCCGAGTTMSWRTRLRSEGECDTHQRPVHEVQVDVLDAEALERLVKLALEVDVVDDLGRHEEARARLAAVAQCLTDGFLVTVPGCRVKVRVAGLRGQLCGRSGVSRQCDAGRRRRERTSRAFLTMVSVSALAAVPLPAGTPIQQLRDAERGFGKLRKVEAGSCMVGVGAPEADGRKLRARVQREA